jgi:hypothetical protein
VGPTSPESAPQWNVDTSPLTAPIDGGSLTAFIADSRRTGRPWTKMTTGRRRPGPSDIVGLFLPIVVPVAGTIMLVVLAGPSLIDAVTDVIRHAPFPYNLIPLGILAVLAVALLVATVRTVLIIRTMIIPRSWWEAAFRLTRFAAANQLRYGHDEGVAYPGVIFDTGTRRVAERRLTTTSGRRVEIGNYRYTIVSDEGKHERVYGWGYVAIALDRRLPHMLLDAKANNASVFGVRTSNLPVDLARDQRLSLGGEFDERFTLYAPREYGRDAFYVFAPDLMALFVDRLGTYDVEIIDDTMFIYGTRFDLLNPRTYAWLREVVDTVIARTVRRTERYTDDRAAFEASAAPSWLTTGDRPPVFESADERPTAATNTVAAQGRRLRRRQWGFWSVVAIALIVAWIYNDFVAPLFGLPRLEHD